MGIFATSRDEQHDYWRDADDAHFRWQTEGGYFAATERELVAMAGIDAQARRVLEIGCGEGANLLHLGARPGWIGVDFAHDKLRHAAGSLAGLGFARCDAAALPFASGHFDAVLIRDVLHHVPDRDAVVAEAARVLRPGGTLAVIEPNRASPLIVAQALLVKEERAVLRSHAGRLADELGGQGLRDVQVRRAQPFPLARVLTNPRLPLSRLLRSGPGVRLLEAADRLARALVPERAWMYLVVRGVKA